MDVDGPPIAVHPRPFRKVHSFLNSVSGLLGIAATSLIGQLICATVGAVLLIALVRALRK
jgi:uncharacterized membrane protein YeaQ/YmgE (transglycosylase-associated protein family)